MKENLKRQGDIMASIFKQQYTVKDSNGKRLQKKSRCWYVNYKTVDGTRNHLLKALLNEKLDNSSNLMSPPDNPQKKNGPGWIRTNEDSRQRVYSPSPLATRAPTQFFIAKGFSSFRCLIRCPDYNHKLPY